MKIKIFIVSKKAVNRQDNTLRQYSREIQNMLGFLGNQIEDITEKQGVPEYQKKTQEQDKAGNAYLIIAAFRSCLDIAASIREHYLYLLQAKNGDRLQCGGLAGERDYYRAADIIKNGGCTVNVKYADCR